jgi:CheY-like chemotaxis protein
VLLVDDEPMLLDVFSRNLILRGWKVTARDDPREALKVLADQAQTVDILVTDRSMPGMGGLDLAAHAKRLRPGLPVALVTGYDDRELGPGTGGVDVVLTKPVGSDALDEALRGLLA